VVLQDRCVCLFNERDRYANLGATTYKANDQDDRKGYANGPEQDRPVHLPGTRGPDPRRDAGLGFGNRGLCVHRLILLMVMMDQCAGLNKRSGLKSE
jgi:hypothetical protein